jgi:hypothetical protein
MKTVKIVFIQTGEINGTFDPHCFLDNFTGDINETCERLISNDMWEPITVPLYSVRELLIPEWMDENEYLTHHISLKFAFAQGMPNDFSKTEFYNFKELSEKYQYFIGWLFEKFSNTKNSFMTSILNQVKEWLKNENNRYPQPLSIKQFEAATKYCPLYNAKRNANAAYHDRH